MTECYCRRFHTLIEDSQAVFADLFSPTFGLMHMDLPVALHVEKAGMKNNTDMALSVRALNKKLHIPEITAVQSEAARMPHVADTTKGRWHCCTWQRHRH